MTTDRGHLMPPQHCHCGRELPCFDHVPHRAGCRMPGCEGECWTGTGYSPAEVRAMAEDHVPIRSADDFLNEEYTYVEPRFANAFREGWNARGDLDVEGIVAEFVGVEAALEDVRRRLIRATDTLGAVARR